MKVIKIIDEKILSGMIEFSRSISGFVRWENRGDFFDEMISRSVGFDAEKWGKITSQGFFV